MQIASLSMHKISSTSLHSRTPYLNHTKLQIVIENIVHSNSYDNKTR